MQIGIGIGIPFARGVGFNVASLFSNGELGTWFDPSDMSTLFQDAAGTTPVTAIEQPVSLMLDKSANLAIGGELVTNGTFDADSDWTKGTGWTIGSGVATKTAGTAAALAQSETLVAGTWYKATFTVTRTAGTVTPRFTGTTTVSGTAISASGTYNAYLLAATGNNSFDFNGDASFAGTIDNVSLKAIAGNHAYTPSTASTSRPTLSARKNWLLATETLATQNVTTRAVPYVLSFWGTGTITLSGTSTAGPLVGTGADDRVYLEFTPTAGTLTLTVSGTVSKAQLEEANDGVS
jgi:hypothetical protein